MEDEHKRAEFLSETFVKKDAGDSLGLELDSNTPNIHSIQKHSPASFSPLRVGDRIVSVNKTDCSLMDSQAIVQYVDALQGKASVVVHNKFGSPDVNESMVSKSSLDEVCGLRMSRKDESSYVHVSSIRPGRIFEDSSLQNVDDRLISVDGVICKDLKTIDVVTIVRQTPVYVTVVVSAPDDGQLQSSFPKCPRENLNTIRRVKRLKRNQKKWSVVVCGISCRPG